MRGDVRALAKIEKRLVGEREERSKHREGYPVLGLGSRREEIKHKLYITVYSIYSINIAL